MLRSGKAGRSDSTSYSIPSTPPPKGRGIRGGGKKVYGKSSSGFLLFEVMVSVAILSLGLVLVLRTFTTSLSAVKVSQNYTRATLLLEEKMWELEKMSKQGGGILTGESSSTFAEHKGFKWGLKATELEDLPLNEVQLAVSWEQGRRRGKISLVTYLRSREKE